MAALFLLSSTPGNHHNAPLPANTEGQEDPRGRSCMVTHQQCDSCKLQGHSGPLLYRVRRGDGAAEGSGEDERESRGQALRGVLCVLV